MRCSGRALFSLVLLGVGLFAVASASRWPFKAAFFPIVVGIPLAVLAGVQLVLDLRGRGAQGTEPALDIQLGGDVPEEVARPRTLTLFMLSYLGFQSGAGWRTTLGLAGAAWMFFYGVFQWLLRLPFEPGWIQTWLGW
jgi:hypothetical protein